MQCFPNFLAWKNPSDNSVYPEEHPFMNRFTGKKKKAVVNAWKLLQYCKLPDKNSSLISREIWNFSLYCNMFMYLLHDFSRNP